MPQNYRDQDPRRYGNERAAEYQRGGRMRSGSDRDRYASGNEQRFSADWDEQPGSAEAFSGDRSYAGGGYPEEFGYRRRGSRDLERGQGERGGDYGSPGRWGREQWDEDSDRWHQPGESRYPRYQQDQQNRRYGTQPWQEHAEEEHRDRAAAPRGEQNRTRSGFSPLRWDDDDNRNTGYYGTGPYHGAIGTQPSSRVSGAGGPSYLTGRDYWAEHNWDPTSEQARTTSGSYESYAQSNYGAQSGYGRDYGPTYEQQRGFGQDYRQRGSEGERFETYGTDRRGEEEFSPRFSPQGAFRGKGPKGYQRSDERLKEMICERLTDDPRIDASDVTIEVKDKVVTLTGTVEDRRNKYMIEDAVEHCGGVNDIDNRLRLRSAASRSGGEAALNPTGQTSGTSTASSRSTETKASSGGAASSGKRGAS